MLITTHTFAGAAISSVFQNPVIGVPLAFGSHFVLDAIVHYDPKLSGFTHNRTLVLVIDFAFALLISIFLVWRTGGTYLLYGIIAATFMDLDVILHLNNRMPKVFPKSLSRLHHNIQNETNQKLLGLITQLILIVMSLKVIWD